VKFDVLPGFLSRNPASEWIGVDPNGTMHNMSPRTRSAPARRPCGRVGAAVAMAALLGLGAGCRPTRTLVIDSVPPGAVVRLDEQVIGRTPLEHRFQHYGERRLSLYSPGYRTHSARIRIGAPWYARFPIDLLTEVILPLGLDHRVELDVVVLEPDDGREAEPAAAGFVSRAGEVRSVAREAAAEARAAAQATGIGPVAPVPDAQAPDAQAPDSQAPDSQAPDSQAPDSQAPDSQAPGATAPPQAP